MGFREGKRQDLGRLLYQVMEGLLVWKGGWRHQKRLVLAGCSKEAHHLAGPPLFPAICWDFKKLPD